MKVNLPVTQREKPFPPGCYLVSKTDLKGIITYANDAFVEISGFTREELIGKNHNVIRHPDMPPQAFEDLWRTVKAGLPWRGLVKNRCKDGDHYWVDAFVVPVRENDQTVGYMSVRSAPSREAVAQAEALYQSLNQSKKALDTSPPWWKRITIRARLIATMAVMAVLLMAVAATGLHGIANSNEALDRTYYARLEPVDLIGRISTLMSDNSRQVMLGLQHNPASSFAKLHDHPLTAHTDAILKNRDEITRLVDELGRQDLGESIQPLLARYTEARKAYVTEGLMPAREALLAGDYDRANLILLQKVNPLYNAAAQLSLEVEDALKRLAREDHEAAEAHYELLRNVMVGGTILAVLLVALSAWNLVASIAGPLSRVFRHFDRIAQGHLTDDVDISGRNEAGQVLTQLAVMQVRLKVMVDEIQAAARAIEEQSRHVDGRTAEVVGQSQEQRDRAASIAAATEEFSQSVREVAEAAQQAAASAESAQTQVAEAQQSMERSTAATRAIAPSCHNSEQLGPKFVNSGSQHALGLDARLTGRVQPQQVHHDVANNSQVVGRVTAAHPGLILVELHIQTPVKPILHLPVAANCFGDALGVRGQAAQVVGTLGAGFVADSAHPLDQGEARDVLPLFALVEPIGGVVRNAAADLRASMAKIRGFMRRGRRERSPWIRDAGKADRVEQLRVVVLHAQHVVGAAFADRARNLRLCAHRVDRHHAAFQGELREQLGNGGDLVGFLGRGPLAQHHAHPGGERADHVQGTCRGLALACRSSAALAVDRNDRVFGQHRHDHADPAPKRRLELVRLNQAEHAPDRVVRRDAMLKLHEPSQPIDLGLGPQLDVDEVVHAREHCTHRDREQFGQVVACVALAARVGNRDEHLRQRHDAYCLHGIPKKTVSYTKYDAVNRGCLSA
ncbi:hypothetical protein C3497_07670 [Zoogloeaceae bacteirum Par-f-2]|nr:hypothetical protein C3497_07670 [Zoogloeaceae bacteirum Par-f-2]